MGYILDIPGIKRDLQKFEGFRTKIYYDSVGKASIGYGRNLADVGISPDEADLMLSNDIQRAISDCQANISFFGTLTDNRQKALVELCFNIGTGKLLGFVKMIQAMKTGNFPEAAQEALNSVWSQQVGLVRSGYIAQLIKNG